MNINEQTYKQYLKRYEQDYQLYLDQDQLWKIKCRKGNSIELASLTEETLLFSLRSGRTARTKSTLLKKLEEAELPYGILQEGDVEINITFPEQRIAEYEELFGIRKRKQLSEEQRQALRERMQRERIWEKK